MEALAVFVGLGILLIPVMLIVCVVKLTSVADELQGIKRLLEMQGDLAKVNAGIKKEFDKEKLQEPVPQKPAAAPTPASAPVPAPAPVSTPRPGPEPAPMPSSAPAPVKYAVPEEPSAVEMFLERIADWFCVRGEFAPEGMSHEFALATRWLVRVGIVMIIGSLIYFAKLSIDRGWMGPTGRVIATLVWGAVGVVAGAYMVKRTKYGILGHAIAAIGIVALYFGFGLGHRFFDPPVVASPTLAFAALFGVTVVAAITSVFLSSSAIAVLALVGGYLVPIIAGNDTGSPLGLDIYLLVINIGAFIVTRFHKWSPLDFLASVLGCLFCFVWCGRHPGAAKEAVLINLIFISCVHLLYMASVVFGAKFRNRAGNALAWAGLSIGACAYFGWIVSYFRMGFTNGITGLVLLGVVAVYLAIAVFVLRRGLADKETVNILLVFALAFLAIAPAFIFDAVWLTMIWSILAVAMSEAEFRTQQKVLGIMAYLVLTAAALTGIFYVVPLEYRNAYNAVNLSTSEYAFASAIRLLRAGSMLAATAWVAKRRRINELLIITGIAVFFCYTAEAFMFGRVFLPSFGSGMVTVAWAVAAFCGVWGGIRRRIRFLRIGSLALLGVSVAKLLFFDTAHLPTPGRVGVFAIVGVLLLIGAFLYIKYKDRFEV